MLTAEQNHVETQPLVETRLQLLDAPEPQGHLAQLLLQLAALDEPMSIRIERGGLMVSLSVGPAAPESRPLNDLQKCILEALGAGPKVADALAVASGYDRRTLYRKPGGLQDLLDGGYLVKTARGYARTESGAAAVDWAEPPFRPNEMQGCILEALADGPLVADRLAERAGYARPTLYAKPHGIGELIDLGLVEKTDRGYGRTATGAAAVNQSPEADGPVEQPDETQATKRRPHVHTASEADDRRHVEAFYAAQAAARSGG